MMIRMSSLGLARHGMALWCRGMSIALLRTVRGVFVYFLYYFVVCGCSDVIEGSVHACGEKARFVAVGMGCTKGKKLNGTMGSWGGGIQSSRRRVWCVSIF